MDERTSDLENAIRVFEKQFNCRLCCHDYSGQLQDIPLPHYHLNVFCTRLKEHREKLTELCMEFDRNQVQNRLMQRGIHPFFKCCHCGMREAVFPIAEEEKLYGVLFAGPFRMRLDADTLFSPRLPRYSVSEPLPELECEQEESFLAYGMLIASNLALGTRKAQRIPCSRKEMIETFLELNLARPIGLPELADTLSLTPARASETVGKLFGKNFCTLLREKRLEQAKLLLRNSAFTMDSVARRCGFRDGAYFHRVFRKALGMPPARYRRENHVGEA